MFTFDVHFLFLTVIRDIQTLTTQPGYSIPIHPCMSNTRQFFCSTSLSPNKNKFKNFTPSTGRFANLQPKFLKTFWIASSSLLLWPSERPAHQNDFRTSFIVRTSLNYPTFPRNVFRTSRIFRTSIERPTYPKNVFRTSLNRHTSPKNLFRTPHI